MAARQQYAWKRSLAVWDVEVGRDVVIGPALINDAFEEVAVVLFAADDPAIERSLRRLVSQRGEEMLCATGRIIESAANAI